MNVNKVRLDYLNSENEFMVSVFEMTGGVIEFVSANVDMGENVVDVYIKFVGQPSECIGSVTDVVKIISVSAFEEV